MGDTAAGRGIGTRLKLLAVVVALAGLFNLAVWLSDLAVQRHFLSFEGPYGAFVKLEEARGLTAFTIVVPSYLPEGTQHEPLVGVTKGADKLNEQVRIVYKPSRKGGLGLDIEEGLFEANAPQDAVYADIEGVVVAYILEPEARYPSSNVAATWSHRGLGFGATFYWALDGGPNLTGDEMTQEAIKIIGSMIRGNGDR